MITTRNKQGWLSIAVHALAAIFFSIPTLSNATTFSNSYNNIGIGELTYSDTNTTINSIGEVFTTNGGTLTDWSFYSWGYEGWDPFIAGNVSLVITNWNGGVPNGPALYTSPTLFYSDLTQPLTFSNINTNLISGSYIASLTLTGIPTPASGLILQMSDSNGGIGEGLSWSWGDSVFSPTWVPPSSLLPPNNLRFSASIEPLSPVPLPAAAWLFGSALLGFVSLSNRRKV